MNAPTFPQTLRSGRVRSILLLVLSLTLAAGGCLMIANGRPAGWFVLGVFILAASIFGLQLLPGASYLELTHEGFTVSTLYRKKSFAWHEVDSFVVVMIGLNRMVGWNFTTNSTNAGTKMGTVSKSLSGCEAALPETYGMKPAALAALLNDQKAAALATAQPAS